MADQPAHDGFDRSIRAIPMQQADK